MADSPHWLDGRLALVTGASRGIGAATAEAIAAAGAHVVLAALDGDALDAVAGRIGATGGQATTVPTDVGRVEDVEELFDAVAASGRLGALVCAAGVLARAPFADTTPELWERTLAINLTGSFLCCQRAFAAMRAGAGGSSTLPRCRGSTRPRSSRGSPHITSPSTASSGSPRRSRPRAGGSTSARSA